MGWSPTLTWLRWGPKYQLHRKILQPPFTKSKVSQYTAMQRKEALICCKGMLEEPAGWVSAVRQFAVAVVINISYGLNVDGPTSPWIKLAEDSGNAIGRSGAPASSIMDRFPPSKSPSHSLCTATLQGCPLFSHSSHTPLTSTSAARYLPDWLPFMERLRYAHTWRWAIESITKLPFDASIENMVSG